MRAISTSVFAMSAFLASLASTPASAAYMLATWQGTIVSGSVSSADNSLVDGLAVGDYTGQAFIATFLYDNTVQPGQMDYSTPGVSSYLFGGGAFGPSPVLEAKLIVGGVTIDLTSPYQGLVQQEHSADGLIFQQSDTSWSTTSFNQGVETDSYFDRGLTLAGYGNAPAALDQDFSMAFDPSTQGYGTASDCYSVVQYGSTFSVNSPYCLNLSLRPDTLTVVDPPAPGGLPSAVPEPSTWAMLIFGFGLVGASLRRRKVLAAA
jgi:hypothetical protein